MLKDSHSDFAQLEKMWGECVLLQAALVSGSFEY